MLLLNQPTWFKRIFKCLKARFRMLRWSLTFHGRTNELSISDLPLKEKVKSSSYPFRLFRYWWASCGIRDEARQLNRIPIVVDLGCERGLMKRFCPSGKPMKWIGLDRDVSRAPLSSAKYDEVLECDFDERLPLPDVTADIVVCLHVLEHLPRPDFTMRECRRILRPGGLLLVGTPIKPKWVALLREKYFRHEFSKGSRKKGKHVNCFWPQRLCDLAHDLGFRTELLSGAYFMRWTGNPLENFSWWVRLNQFLGALFLGLGGEICYSARLIDKGPNAPAPALVLHDGFLSLKAKRRMAWAAGLAACIAVVFSLIWEERPVPNTQECVIADMIRKHQDGDDVFYVTGHPAFKNIEAVEHVHVIEDIIAEHISMAYLQNTEGRDPHFVIPCAKLAALLQHPLRDRISLVDEVTVQGTRYLLLGTEGYGKPIRDLS